MLFVEGGEVECFEVDSATGLQEGCVNFFLTGVPGTGVAFVGFVGGSGVFC